MIKRAPWLFACLVFGLLAPNVLRAEGPPEHAAFALVIGNNHSLDGRRPDLHYADDDAAKYFEILKTIAGERVFLLADLDRDTARLFPEARAHALAPTRAELARVGRELAARIAALARAGQASDVYFVFAGHGDVAEGQGFIELLDGRFDAREFEAFLRAIPFARAHVILDSCNSFFMLATRRPGGRYYATSEDASRALAKRLPNVGVFLSTSADGDAFEWSEIQSGVFSHIVRSGLLGAADANHDGAVDYRELAAFVATATTDVANPNMRPHVFARGPSGHDDEPIVRLPSDKTRVLQLSQAAPLRIRLRDREGLPFLDAHAEAGTPLTIAMPDAWAEGATLERSDGTRASAGELLMLPPEPRELTLTALEPVRPRGSARGPAEIFQHLFARPFGPRALAAYLAELRAAPPPVYGVSREDAERMQLLLDQIAGAEHGNRLLAGTLNLAEGVYFGAYGASVLAFEHTLKLSNGAAALLSGFGFALSAANFAAGIYRLASPWAGERLAVDYRAALAQGDYARAFALTNERLRELAASERRTRFLRGVTGGALIAVSTSFIVAEELTSQHGAARFNARAFGGAGILLGVLALADALLLESPIERLLAVWERDPGRVRLVPSVAPIPGGAELGVAGRF